MVEHCGRTERNGWKEITKKLRREGTVGRWDGGQEHGRQSGGKWVGGMERAGRIWTAGREKWGEKNGGHKRVTGGRNPPKCGASPCDAPGTQMLRLLYIIFIYNI